MCGSFDNIYCVFEYLFYLNTKKYIIYNFFYQSLLLFITFSRGSYLVFVVTLIIILFYKKLLIKNAIIDRSHFY